MRPSAQFLLVALALGFLMYNFAPELEPGSFSQLSVIPRITVNGSSLWRPSATMPESPEEPCLDLRLLAKSSAQDLLEVPGLNVTLI